MSKVIEGTIVNVAQGQNLFGLYAYKLTVKTDKKFIKIIDFGYERSGVWDKNDIGRSGIFEYGWDLLNGTELKSCRLNEEG